MIEDRVEKIWKTMKKCVLLLESEKFDVDNSRVE